MAEEDNFFGTNSRLSQFEAFASEQPLHTLSIGSIKAKIDNEFYESSQIPETTSTEQQLEIMKSIGDDEESWELEDSGEETIKPIATNIEQSYDAYDDVSPNIQASMLAPNLSSKSEESEDDESEKENYDDYFTQHRQNEDPEVPSSKTVRFDKNIEQVAVLTPKDSLDQLSTSSTTSDTDEMEDIILTSDFQAVSDRITDYMNVKETDNNETSEVTKCEVLHSPESHISLTESEDLPPPLPLLPPIHKKKSNCSVTLLEFIFIHSCISATPVDNIPTKPTVLSTTSGTDLKPKIYLNAEPGITTSIQRTTDANFTRSFDSGTVINANRVYSRLE